MKRGFVKKDNTGKILLDISKAFGRIDRKQLWRILYEKGLPVNLIKLIKGTCGKYTMYKI